MCYDLRMGCIDIAGSGGVHLVGGVAGLVGTMMLGPRLQRYDNGYSTPSLGNPTNALVGMFMLWYVCMTFITIMAMYYSFGYNYEYL